jgi:type II secretory pathway pseudopilin PulG
MKRKKRKAFILVEIIVGLALIGLLASVAFPSITATRLGIIKVEKKATAIDQAQRIVQTLKPPTENNNNLMNALMVGDSIEYEDSLLTSDLIASVCIDSNTKNYQVYTVEVKFLEVDISAKFQAARNLE